MGNTDKKKKRIFGLRGKFIFWIILAGLLITAASVIAGAEVFSRSIIEHYNNEAYRIANIAASYFTPEELEEYGKLTLAYHRGEADEKDIEAVTGSERYQEIVTLLGNLRRSVDANGIYTCVFDNDELKSYTSEALEAHTWNPICYISDSFHNETKQMHFGDSGPVSPDLIDDVYKLSTTGERVHNYFLANGNYGYNTTAFLPVTKDLKTIGVMAVEIPVATLDSARQEFIRNVVLVAAAVLIILLLIMIPVLVRTLVRPVRTMAREADSFVQNNNEISTTLEKIRTNDEIEDLSRNIVKLERDVNSYIDNIRTVTAEKERIGAELNIATQIQADMLPSIFPPFPNKDGFDIYAIMNPAKEVGGDFYDFFMVDKDHLALVIADVSGKGVPAALFMVIAKTLIKNRTQTGDSPAKVLEEVNAQLCEGNEAELFVTVWLAVIEISTGKGIAANAGHEHPAIRRANGNYELCVYKHSPAVATMEGIKFREHEFMLYPGDALFVYTDGVPEATNSKDELYGTDRMLRVLNQNADVTPEQLLRDVRTDIGRFVGTAPQFDDITMMSFYYHVYNMRQMKAMKDYGDAEADPPVPEKENADAAAAEEGPADTMTNARELIVDAVIEKVPEVTAFADAQLEEWNCSFRAQTQIDVAIDELFSNIAYYAYPDEPGKVTVRMGLEEDGRTVRITFIDSGVPYDPLKKEDPDVTLSAEERAIGGLGIFLVKKTMDKIDYEYRNKQNILTIRKTIVE